MDDRDIVALYLDRNEQAIKECQGKYGTMCHTLARRILGDDLDSEECVNDTWMAAWKSIPPNKPAALAPYLGRIVRNLASTAGSKTIAINAIAA